MQDERGFRDLFEGGAKSVDERGGRLRMKPTVSLSRIRRRDGRMSARTTGSSVANMRASARTPAVVMRLKRVDLPALV
jgi:hypothetical protein